MGLSQETLSELFDLPRLAIESGIKVRLDEEETFEKTKRHLEILASNSNFTPSEIEEGLADSNPSFNFAPDQRASKNEDDTSSDILNRFLRDAKKKLLP